MRTKTASDDRRRTGSRPCRLMVLVLAQAVLVSIAAGAEEESPDLDLLAYLGSWQGTDEEWLAVAEWDAKSEADGEEPEPNEEQDDE